MLVFRAYSGGEPVDRFVRRVMDRPQSGLVRYGLGIGFMAAALAIQALLTYVTSTAFASAVVFIAIVLATLLAGTGPGIASALTAVLVGVARALLEQGPDGLSRLAGPLVAYSVLSALLIYLAALLRKTMRETAASRAMLQDLFDNMQQPFVLYRAIRSRPDGPYDDLVRIDMNAAARRTSSIPIAPGSSVMTGYRGPREYISDLLTVALTGQGDRWERPGSNSQTWFELVAYSPSPGNVALLMTDVTERHRESQARDLLAREIEHRSKNLFNLVLALLGMMRGRLVDADLIGRMEALARTHFALSYRVGVTAAMDAIVRAELAPFGADPAEGGITRVGIEGPGVPLNASQAQAVGMAIHELATNAVKYGCLSVPGGRLSVRWTQDPAGRVELLWSEAGGPAVETPQHSGFGGKLLRSLIEGQLEGSLEQRWDSAGAQVTIRFPASPDRRHERAAQ